MKNLLQPSLKMVLFYIIFLTSATNAFTQDWNQIIKMTAKNNGGSSARSDLDFYGISVAISGNYAVVGSNNESEDAGGSNTVTSAGAAYIFYRDQDNWIQMKKIVAPVRSFFDYFGISVAIDGEYVIVGAMGEDEDVSGANTVNDAGAAYIFKKDLGGADNWGLLHKITSSDRGNQNNFGYSVSINGNYAIVGSPYNRLDVSGNNSLFSAGAVYIFRKDQGGVDNWEQSQKMVAPVRAIGDVFGASVSLSGSYAIAGAYGESEDVNESNTLNSSGSAYIFKRDQEDDDHWDQVKKITASSRAANDNFGQSVSISGDYAVVGAYLDDEDAAEANTLSSSGSAFMFKKDEGGTDNWGQIKKITSPFRAVSDQFGISVSINGDNVIVGAHFEDEDALEANTLFDAGAVYIFKKDEGGADNWGHVQKIVASARAHSNNFGRTVAISGNHLIVGVPNQDEDDQELNTLANSGAVYIFENTGALPVILTTFEAVEYEDQALLSWTTTMESNSHYFDIHKSADGLIWTTLERVLASVKSDQLRTYSFVDNNPLNEDSPSHLYRLKMVDIDGRFAYSRIVSLSFENNRRTILYPNPASDMLYFRPADAGKIASITMINSAGKVALRAMDGSRAAISVNGLTPGVYMAQIRKKAGAVQFQKVVVAR